jgi:hypothetical protein
VGISKPISLCVRHNIVEGISEGLFVNCGFVVGVIECVGKEIIVLFLVPPPTNFWKYEVPIIKTSTNNNPRPKSIESKVLYFKRMDP